MLKTSASFVLASLRGSGALEGIFRSPRSILRANGHTKCGWYLLVSWLAAAAPVELRVLARQGWAGENCGHFEHPAGSPCAFTIRMLIVDFDHTLRSSVSC
jgi:hypothetical protein